MRYVLHACVLLALLPALARADVTVKDSTGATVTYDTSTSGSVHTGHTVTTDGAGTRQFTSSAPGRIDPTGTTTQPVSAASLPLPSGASTSAAQASALTELQSILAKLNAALGALGQTTMAGSTPVAIASNQSAVPVSGTVTVGSITAGTNNIGDVDVLTLPALVAGTANIGDVDVLTIAAGDNNIGNMDVASIAAGNNNIGDVDIAGALPAGTNAIGKLAANSGVDIGDVDVTSVSAPSAIYHGQTTVTTAGTEVTLGASQTLTQGCWIKAKAANTGFIYVGANPVTSSTGYELDALESIFVPITNRTTIYIDSSVNAESASYVCF